MPRRAWVTEPHPPSRHNPPCRIAAVSGGVVPIGITTAAPSKYILCSEIANANYNVGALVEMAIGGKSTLRSVSKRPLHEASPAHRRPDSNFLK